MSAKDMRKHARNLYKMAESIELIEIAQEKGPEAARKFVVKKLEQKMNRKIRYQVRKAINKSFGL